MEAEKFTGIVEWFNPELGYGFIRRANELDIFVHWSDVSIEGFKTLKKDQKVSFSIGLNNRGAPKATEVTILEV